VLAVLLLTCKPEATGPSATAATHVKFSVKPSNTTAGATIAPAVQVSARNAEGKLVSSFTGTITLEIGTNPGGGTLSGTTTVAAVNGVATFSNLSIDKAGTGYRLIAAAGGLAPSTSSKFDITGGSASQLSLMVGPTATTAGEVISPSVEVAALDALENTADGYTGDVTVTITAGTGTAGATLTGATTAAAAGGLAVFSDLSIDMSGTDYTLTVSASGLPNATSAPFDILSGTATELIFTVQPTDAIAGESFSPAVVVTALDAQGNTATDYTGNVTVELTGGTGTSGAKLLGTRTVAAVAGVATFDNVSVDKSGTGYTMSARASGRTGATSTAFAIAPGAVSQLVFLQQPSTTTAGVIIAPPVQVAVQDSLDNTVPSFAGTVTLTIDTNPGGGTLSGTTTVTLVNGIATFSDLSIDRVGVGYRLEANGGGLTRTSNAFSIREDTATQLAFTVQPTTTRAGASISPSVEVTALDAFGNPADGYTDNITVTITPGTGTAGATLAGITTAAAVSGVAVFSDLNIDLSGTGYTLTASASASGLTGTASAAFDIVPASAAQLVFTVQPTDAVGGDPFNPAVVVTALDPQGNTATDFIGNVTVELTGGTGTSGAKLLGTRTVGAVAGVATFTNVSVDKSGTGYTLSARASGATGATSTAFAIAPGAVNQLVFIVQPTTSTAGTIISPPVQVAAQDSLDNTVPSFTATITLTIGTNPGGGTLSGTTAVTPVNGIATFADLSIDKVGVGYRLVADGGGFTRTSNAFSITVSTATQVSFTVEPTDRVAGGTITPAVEVTARDALGNPATGFTGDVTLAITAGTGTPGAILSGTTTVTAFNGVAVFSDLSIDLSGTSYTLTRRRTVQSGRRGDCARRAGERRHRLHRERDCGPHKRHGHQRSHPVGHPDRARGRRRRHLQQHQRRQERDRLHPVGPGQQSHRGHEHRVRHRPRPGEPARLH
jgi:hypothetical protein